jgi:hypothetical protein
MLTLIASSDDYLLEERLQRAVDAIAESLGGVDPEFLPADVTAETLAVEIQSPSLFNPTRVLVLPEIRHWLDAMAPPGAAKSTAEADVAPLVAELEKGLPEGIGVVMGAWCGRQPKGPLVASVQAAGRYEWIPVPSPPKPWEDVVLSEDQRRVLREVLGRAAGGVRFSAAAENLLFERLGFAPRQLVTEVGKLAAAAGAGVEVDEELVRELTFPRERSLEVVRDAVLQREISPLLDLLGAAASGMPIVDWQGQRLDPSRLPLILFPQVFDLVHQMLFLRRTAAATGHLDEMDPKMTSHRGWYGRRFKEGIFPELASALEEQGPTPLTKRGKPPTPWTLGQLFSGAGRYRDGELQEALAAAGEVEAQLRGNMPLESLTVWLTRLLRAE